MLELQALIDCFLEGLLLVFSGNQIRMVLSSPPEASLEDRFDRTVKIYLHFMIDRIPTDCINTADMSMYSVNRFLVSSIPNDNCFVWKQILNGDYEKSYLQTQKQ